MSKTKKLKRKEKKNYKKEKCQFIYDLGHKRFEKNCKRNAIGEGTLCKKHGGMPSFDNMLVTTTGDKETEIYDPSYSMKAIQLANQGCNNTEIAASLGVSILTLNRWTEKYIEFYEAMEIARSLNEAWWLKKGKANLTNVRFQTPLFKFLTGNTLGYSDKIESKSMNMNMHGVLMVPGKVSDKEWEAEAAEVNDEGTTTTEGNEKEDK